MKEESYMLKGYFRPQITYLRSYNLIQTTLAPGLERLERFSLSSPGTVTPCSVKRY